MKDKAFDTKALHLGYDPKAHNGASNPPIYETASFSYDTAEELEKVFQGRDFGHLYTRISNPTISMLETKIAGLENGVSCSVTSSGMSAITVAILTLTQAGDEIISSKSIFGGTFLFFNKVLKKFGVKVNYVDATDINEYEKAINERTKCIFVESLANPKLDVPDIKKLSQVASDNNIPLIVDSTLTTPYLLDAKKLGVSLVIHSATKYLSGNGSLIGGAVVDLGNYDWSKFDSDDFNEIKGRVAPQFLFTYLSKKHIHQNIGSCISPFNAYHINVGLETLSLRMDRHCDNAMKVAIYLSGNSKVDNVNYVGLDSSPFKDISRKQFNAKFGGLLTIRLGSKDRCFKFINNLELARNLANLGDTKTLVIHPSSTIYYECSEEEKNTAGAYDDLVRVSIGIEDSADIISDFDNALSKL